MWVNNNITQKTNSVVIMLPESKVLRTYAKFSDTYPGCRVVIQTYFSASSTSFSWDVWVCACAVKVNGLPRSFTPNSSQSTHTATLTLSKTVCPSQFLLLFQREGGKPDVFLSVSPFRGHASARWRAPGGLLESRVDKCLQMHFIFISSIKPGAEHRALR